MSKQLYDTVQAAKFLGLSRESVSRLVLSGRLASTKYGRARLIKESDLIEFKAIERKPGRPAKAKGETGKPAKKRKANNAPQTDKPTKKTRQK